jgi:hypothetical protein
VGLHISVVRGCPAPLMLRWEIDCVNDDTLGQHAVLANVRRDWSRGSVVVTGGPTGISMAIASRS